MFAEVLVSMLEEIQKEAQFQDFWVGDNIPPSKLGNAIEYYPIDPSLTVVGLIDCTVMGSCKNGLAITDAGLIWNNSWTTPTTKNYLTWEELANSIENMEIDDYAIDFGGGVKFGTAGSAMSTSDIFGLLCGLVVGLAMVLEDEDIMAYLQNVENSLNEENNNLNSGGISTEEQETYVNALIPALALMTASDGDVEDDEIELLVAFINEEELITDKEQALAEFESHIDKLVTSYAKSQALFNLQSSKLIAGIAKLDNKELISRLEVMLEGMMQVAGGTENKPTFEMMKKIMANFG